MVSSFKRSKQERRRKGPKHTTDITEVKTDGVAVTVSCTVTGLGSGDVCLINVKI